MYLHACFMHSRLGDSTFPFPFPFPFHFHLLPIAIDDLLFAKLSPLNCD